MIFHAYPKDKPREEGKYFCSLDYEICSKNRDYSLHTFDYKMRRKDLSLFDWKGKGFYECTPQRGWVKVKHVYMWVELTYKGNEE